MTPSAKHLNLLAHISTFSRGYPTSRSTDRELRWINRLVKGGYLDRDDDIVYLSETGRYAVVDEYHICPVFGHEYVPHTGAPRSIIVLAPRRDRRRSPRA